MQILPRLDTRHRRSAHARQYLPSDSFNPLWSKCSSLQHCQSVDPNSHPRCRRREGAHPELTLLFIGKKGFEYFRRRFSDIAFNTDFIHIYDQPSYENTSALAKKLMDEFESGKYDAIDLVYSRFKNAATQIPTAEQWLPVAKLEVSGEKTTKKADYIFEPDKVQLLETLVPSILQLQFHKCILDTAASEHGARMTAMDNATENAEELLKSLRINYNKARQEAITKELSEIVGGVAALEG